MPSELAMQLRAAAVALRSAASELREYRELQKQASAFPGRPNRGLGALQDDELDGFGDLHERLAELLAPHNPLGAASAGRPAHSGSGGGDKYLERLRSLEND